MYASIQKFNGNLQDCHGGIVEKITLKQQRTESVSWCCWLLISRTRQPVRQINRQTDWLTNWLTAWSINRSINWMIDWLTTDWLICWFILPSTDLSRDVSLKSAEVSVLSLRGEDRLILDVDRCQLMQRNLPNGFRLNTHPLVSFIDDTKLPASISVCMAASSSLRLSLSVCVPVLCPLRMYSVSASISFYVSVCASGVCLPVASFNRLFLYVSICLPVPLRPRAYPSVPLRSLQCLSRLSWWNTRPD